MRFIASKHDSLLALGKIFSMQPLKLSPTSCLRDVPWENIFKFGAFVASSEFF